MCAASASAFGFGLLGGNSGGYGGGYPGTKIKKSMKWKKNSIRKKHIKKNFAKTVNENADFWYQS